MATLGDRVFDNGLTVLDTEVTHLYITSAEATSYANVTAVDLGVKAAPTISAPADRTGGGRKVTVSAITDGSVTDSGTASHYALTDNTNSRLLATGALSAPQGVTSGNTFQLNSFDIGIPDPA